LEFIVMVQDSGLEGLAKEWRADKKMALKRYAEFQAQNPAFADLVLKGVNYSGELILSQPAPASPTERTQVSRRVVEGLRKAPLVVYADPNASGQPGKE
jgi:hypothetical protein